MGRFATLFLLLPIVDFYLLIQIGRSYGFWPAVGLVMATGVVGMSMLRGHGLARILASRSQLEAGTANPQAIVEALAFFIGGVLLIAPGPITDFLGLSILFPPTRRLLLARARRWAERKIRSGQVQMGGMGQSGIGVWTFSTSGGFGSPPGARYGGTVEAEPVEEDGGSFGRRALDPSKEIRLPPKGSDG